MNALTYYEASAGPALQLPPLRGREEADVGIVGGGFAGLGTAMGLLERGRRHTVVLEAKGIGHGASGRNGGFVFGGYSLSPQALVRQLGLEPARALYGMTLKALDTIERRIASHGIDCERVAGGALWADWFGDEPAMRRELDFMRQQMQADWHWVPRDELQHLLRTRRYHGALREPRAFHFHPLKYARGLARALAAQGVGVHERSPALHIERQGAGWRVRTPEGELQVRELLLACGGYLQGLHRPLQAAMLPIATYVMATEPLGERLKDAVNTPAAVYDTRFAFDYYRALPDTRLLWGGRISILQRSPQAVARLLRADLARVYPQLRDVRIDHAWSGLMSYARHTMPQVGRTPEGLWYAMGFGGHGVGPTTAAGELLADALMGAAALPPALARYGLSPVHGHAGLLAAQAQYSWAQARDAWRDWRTRRTPG